jgi:hypothetical protein
MACERTGRTTTSASVLFVPRFRFATASSGEIEARRDDPRKVDRMMANYVKAISDVVQMAPLLDKLRTAKGERDRLLRAIAAMERVDARSFNLH